MTKHNKKCECSTCANGKGSSNKRKDALKHDNIKVKVYVKNDVRQESANELALAAQIELLKMDVFSLENERDSAMRTVEGLEKELATAKSQLKTLQKEVAITRNFIHDNGLEFALLSKLSQMEKRVASSTKESRVYTLRKCGNCKSACILYVNGCSVCFCEKNRKIVNDNFYCPWWKERVENQYE